jgi:hypothetical protein
MVGLQACFEKRDVSPNLQVLMLPFQASRTRPGDKPDPSSPVLHFPMLRKVVEFDVGGTLDFKPAKFM